MTAYATFPELSRREIDPRGVAQARYAGGVGVSSGRQLIEQRFGVFQIARVKPFSEPAGDRSEKLASLISIALIAPEPAPCSLRRTALRTWLDVDAQSFIGRQSGRTAAIPRR
jgi:hypothetical protein